MQEKYVCYRNKFLDSSGPVDATDHMILADIGMKRFDLAINITCFPSKRRRYKFCRLPHFGVRNSNFWRSKRILLPRIEFVAIKVNFATTNQIFCGRNLTFQQQATLPVTKIIFCNKN